MHWRYKIYRKSIEILSTKTKMGKQSSKVGISSSEICIKFLVSAIWFFFIKHKIPPYIILKENLNYIRRKPTLFTRSALNRAISANQRSTKRWEIVCIIYLKRDRKKGKNNFLKTAFCGKKGTWKRILPVETWNRYLYLTRKKVKKNR